MKKNIRLIIVIAFLLFVFYYMYTGKSTLDSIASIYIPIVVVFYTNRITELSKSVSEEQFKKKRRKLHIILFFFSWIFQSTIEVIKDVDSFAKVEWLKALGFGLFLAVLVYIGVCVFDHFAKRLSKKAVK